MSLTACSLLIQQNLSERTLSKPSHATLSINVILIYDDVISSITVVFIYGELRHSVNYCQVSSEVMHSVFTTIGGSPETLWSKCMTVTVAAQFG